MSHSTKRFHTRSPADESAAASGAVGGGSPVAAPPPSGPPLPRRSGTVKLPDDEGPTLSLPSRELAASQPDKSTLRAGTFEQAASQSPVPGHTRRCPDCGKHYSATAAFCALDGQRLMDANDWDPSDDPIVGKLVAGRYQVLSVIAEGGMGTVYKVEHSVLGNVFAMKVLRRDQVRNADVAARLINEARAIAGIGHPNIVAVTDFGMIDASLLPELHDQQLPFFIMELVRGSSLANEIRGHGPLDPVRVMRIMIQCVAALSAAHEHGVIHRDLKPENILLVRSESGEGETPKLLDFGVAKMLGSKKTRLGTTFGTPHYMSPEQGQGQKVDGRSDVYSVGVLLYECLTGRVPFEADTYMNVITKHAFEKPEPFPAGDKLCLMLEPVVMRCLEKQPEHRYQSMAELGADLTRVLQGQAPRASFQKPLQLREPVPQDDDRQEPAGSLSQRRGSVRWLVIGGLALAVVVGAAVLIAFATKDEPTSEPAVETTTVPTGSPEPSLTGSSPAVAAAPPPSSLQVAAASASASATARATARATAPLARPPIIYHPPPPATRPPPSEVVDPWKK